MQSPGPVPPWPRRRTEAILVALGCLGAGFLYRIAGGYLAGSIGRSWDWMPMGGEAKAIFAIPFGLALMLASKNALVGLVGAVVMWTSLFVDLHPYASVGERIGAPESMRPGLFDWLVGRALHGWDNEQRYLRDYVALSLGGLLQTAPLGIVLDYFGFGWVFMLLGAGIAPTYYLAHLVHIHSANFGSGVPLAQLLWGAVLWLVAATSALAYQPLRLQPRLVRGWLMRQVLLVLLETVYATSAIWYISFPQEDTRVQRQTFGATVALLWWLLLCHVLGLAYWSGVRYVRRTRGWTYRQATMYVVSRLRSFLGWSNCACCPSGRGGDRRGDKSGGGSVRASTNWFDAAVADEHRPFLAVPVHDEFGSDDEPEEAALSWSRRRFGVRAPFNHLLRGIAVLVVLGLVCFLAMLVWEVCWLRLPQSSASLHRDPTLH